MADPQLHARLAELDARFSHGAEITWDDVSYLAQQVRASLRAFRGAATVESGWPAFEDNFYCDPTTNEWVYRWADERIVAAERSV